MLLSKYTLSSHADLCRQTYWTLLTGDFLYGGRAVVYALLAASNPVRLVFPSILSLNHTIICVTSRSHAFLPMLYRPSSVASNPFLPIHSPPFSARIHASARNILTLVSHSPGSENHLVGIVDKQVRLVDEAVVA